MQGTNHAQKGERRRRRKKKERSFSSKLAKYRSLVIGFVLIMSGVLCTLYTFDYQLSPGSWFEWENVEDMVNLWPFAIVLLGFVLVIADYIRNSKSRYK